MFSKTVVALFASATLVAGHGWVDEFVANNQHYVGTKNWNSPENKKSPVRMIPQDTGFVDYRKVNTMDIACSSAGYAGTPVTAPVDAGSTVDIRWAGDKGPSGNIWPHPEGPELTYLANCNGDCSTFDPRNAKFFKIQEAGLDTSKRPIQNWIDHKPAGDGLWIQNKAMMEGGWFHVTIPKDIADGNYLLRHELISLHGAHSRAEGAQYYPICIQIKVQNGGSSKPAGIPATQLYTQEDGIVDIWAPFPNGIKNYKIPGPAIYAAGKSTEPAPPAPAPPAATTTRVSTSAPTPTKPAGNGKPSSSPYNNNNAAVTSASVAPAKPSVRLCKPKPKRAAKRSSVEDETRELYDRALTRSRARRAHAQHGSGSF